MAAMMSLLRLGCFAALTVPPALAQQCNLLLSLDARHYQQGSDTWAASPGTSVAGTINRDVGSITFDANEGALRFSGAAVVTAPVNINPGPNPELTIEIVLKPANSMNYARTNAWIISSDNGGYDRSICVADARFGGVGAPAGNVRESGLGYPEHNSWNFVAGVWNVNGVHSGTQQSFAWMNNSKGTVYASNNNRGDGNIRIGAYNPGVLHHAFDGWISEVRVYDCAKTDGQLRSAYQSFLGRYSQTTSSTRTTTTTTSQTATTRTVEIADITRDVSELFSEVGRLENLIRSQTNIISSQASQIAALTASTSSIRSALSSAVGSLPNTGMGDPSDDCISSPSDPNCVPSLSTSGNDVVVAAKGGRVTFDTGACGTVDPCSMVTVVEALSNALGSL